MRKLGYILLILGFIAVMHVALDRISHALRIAGREQEALLPQDAFTRKQVEDAILHATLASRPSDTAAILPGFLMLCGAIVLDCAKTRRKGLDRGA